MSKAKKGQVVHIHYTGTLDDGTVFDSSREREPLKFTLGAGMVIPGFDIMVTDMTIGDTKKETIAAKDAYGDPREDLILSVEKEQLPPDMTPAVGMKLQAPMQNGHVAILTVTDVSDTHVTLDGNHELAGQDLTFDIELVDISEPEEDMDEEHECCGGHHCKEEDDECCGGGACSKE
ncbi:peptidylprolyl isomerase [Patescibacteria group bacterium]|nr:peptidylprolyl isomerase [Patescibacteria group bacterium]MBU1721354.1 peptidylprolyl isomerase [Patescibacteria group bacterium]MBU1901562.1 peptidylprolyl isomerase [Patescibacteria group bacterium]